MANPFSNVGATLLDRVFSSVFWIGLAIVLIAIIGYTLWYFIYLRRKFDIEVKILSQRADGKFNILKDKAAILYDKKDKINFFRLWKTKYDLPVPAFEQGLQQTNEGDLLELWRTGENRFVPLTPPSINRNVIVRADGKEYHYAQPEHKQIEGDIDYWHTKRKEKQKGLFDTESLIFKLLPFLPHIFTGVIIIFILYILMDSLPGLIQALIELTGELKDLKGVQTIETWMLMLK